MVLEEMPRGPKGRGDLSSGEHEKSSFIAIHLIAGSFRPPEGMPEMDTLTACIKLNELNRSGSGDITVATPRRRRDSPM